MHTVWKGAISFGLVHVPVKMHSATEDKDIHFRQLHKECKMPISYEKNVHTVTKLLLQMILCEALSMRRINS